MQETQGANRPDDNRSQNIFHRENGPANSEELQRDEAFRAFFTKTVIEVPEDMRHVTGEVLLEEETEKPRKKSFWPWARRKQRQEEQELETAAMPSAEESTDAESTEAFSFAFEPEAPSEEETEAPEPTKQPEPAAEPEEKTEPEEEPTGMQEPEGSDPAQEAPEAEPVPAPEPPARDPFRAVCPAIDPEELLRRTAGQKVSVDELLSQIGDLEAGKQTMHPAQEPAPDPKPDPMERFRRQSANAAAGKEHLDAMLSDIYQHAVEETSMELVEEAPADREPAPQEMDPDQRVVEIPLNLQTETEPAAEPEEITGEISFDLPETPDTEEVGEIRFVPETPAAELQAEQNQPAEEKTGEICFAAAAEPEASVSEIAFAPAETCEAAETAAEETTREIPDTMNTAQSPAAEPAGQAAEEEPAPAREKPWRTSFRQMLGVLGLTGDDEEPEDEEPDAAEDTAETEQEAAKAAEPVGDAADDLAAAAAEPPARKLHALLHKLRPAQETENGQSAAEPAAPALEYNTPEDAPQLQELLDKRCRWLTLGTVLAGILAAALLVLDVMGQMGLAPAAGIDPVAAPTAWLLVNLLLLAGCALLYLPGMRAGIQSILPGGKPTADALPALAVCGAAVQLLLALLLQSSFQPTTQAVFAGMAAVMVFIRLLGKRMSVGVIRGGFADMTAGTAHATAYRLENPAMTQFLCDGLENSDPVVMLSRPDALLSGFVAQSSAPHFSDVRALLLARILGVSALVGALISLVRSGNAVTAGSVLAGVLAMGVPLGMLLLRGMSTLLMAKSAGRVGAVVPGWSAIEQLGEVDVLHVDAAQLFPPVCAYLNGIKTFREERIDSAILYATSILIAGCSTLEGLFRGMIENHTDMLYPVKELECRSGLGFVAWCDNCRVLLGTREMMRMEGISLPAREYENRYTHNGHRHVLYLAVSGKLYAMFLFGYNGTKQVARTLNVLRRENIQLLVTAQDPTLTQQRIEAIYRLRPGSVKVLSAEENEEIAPAVSHLPCQDGCMAHQGSFMSLVGGLRAAAGAEDAQHSGSMFLTISTIVSVVIGLLLSVSGGMATISLGTIILYQLAWLIVCLAVAAGKKY